MHCTNSKDGRETGNRKKIVLAYSGGLDTSVAIKWLEDRYDVDVVAVSIDLGQPGDMEANVERARSIGAVSAYAVDAKKEFAEDYIWPALKANALYQGVYPLSTAIARPLIAKILVDVARKEGAQSIAHGCTAKGNDQVRFDVSIGALAPELGIVAPMREWVMTREEEIDYAKENGIPIPVKKASPYSVDENLWGRSCECGVLEDASQEPPEDSRSWTVSPQHAPDMPAYVEIGFEKGVPVSLDGERLDAVELIVRLNELAGSHGVGRIDHVEDRLVGIKSRETYECPAAITLTKAHQSLEGMVLTRDVLSYKKGAEQRYAELAYDGYWFSPLREALDAFMEKTQEFVTGTVRVKLFKGMAEVVGRSSPHSLYNEGLATYAKGDEFDHTSAKGFIYVWGLPLRTAASAYRTDEASGDRGE
ncbi:argininosuccinate synthase [Methanomassiliicoccales archaeon RumEn M1]|jgi:argininosuccinate synthase|nr:argininosuccinate synthase [Methanomassiliicoccales archaeon RumEn M1]